MGRSVCIYMKPQGKKSVNIEDSIHKEISVASAMSDKDMYVLIREAWVAYKEAQEEKAGKGESHEVDPQQAEYVAAFLEAIKVAQDWIQLKPILQPYLEAKKAKIAKPSKPKRVSDKLKAS